MAFDLNMNFFFVYDTTSCKSDEDDPKDGVVILFPVQQSESQGHFLCCQLAGVAKFLKSSFSSPAVIGLEQGKFAFFWSGKYLLGLGADSEVHTNVLKDQLQFLCGIFCFYHGNMSNVLKECKNNRSDFLLKLELCWSRYIALSQCFGSVLQLSLKALPLKTGRKGSSAVSTANRLLHLCQMSSFVTAGAVFYNSKVLSTQFPPQLSNYLSLLSNSNASAPVNNAHHTPKTLPPDVELKSVYLSPKCISSIHKLNHACTGSHIRLKTRAHGSGSEGDVDSGKDSGNCSESMRRRTNSSRKPSRNDLGFCSSLTLAQLEKNLVLSRNRCLLSLTGGDPCRRHGDSGTDDSVTFKRDFAFGVGSLLCSSHAHLRSASFLTKSSPQHADLTSSLDAKFTSSVDADFRCSLCRTFNGPRTISELSLKKWNSDFHISKLCHSSHLASRLCDCSRLASRYCGGAENGTDSPKVQVLKCRSNSEGRSKRSRSSKRASVGRGSKDRSRSYSFCDNDKCPNIEENDLQKHVLYVQRYGGSTLVLLLDKVYDKKVINYLWNCGFTFLRELECSSEKLEVEIPSYNIEPSFYILLYNHAQRILKEYPHFPSLLLTEKHSRETIQKIQEDFKIDAHFQLMCLLSSHYSIFASHRNHSLAFYLQPESSSRKLDPLLHLGMKAARRLGKYFKVEM